MRPKHTPGPWVKSTSSGMIRDSENKAVAIALRGHADTEANAALIAAAPEMLELIMELVDQPGQLHEDIVRMKRILAKVRGKGIRK